MASFFPLIDNDDAPCTCDNCEWTGPASAVEPIQSAQERLSAGSIVPAGECPECGSLAYLDKPKT